jgi:hypothetical protein
MVTDDASQLQALLLQGELGAFFGLCDVRSTGAAAA